MNIDTEIHDFIDLLNFTLSKEFLDKWRFKYGDRLIRVFQHKILSCLKKSKNIKILNLQKFLSNDSGFSQEVVNEFLREIDSEIYHPIIVK